jgi:hypothetical protein
MRSGQNWIQPKKMLGLMLEMKRIIKSLELYNEKLR